VPQSWLLEEEDSRNQGERVAEEAAHRMQQSIKRAAVPCCGEPLHQIRGIHVAKAIHTHLPSRIASSRLVINLLLTSFLVHVNPICALIFCSLSLSSTHGNFPLQLSDPIAASL
jgi:hypothetical protein